MCDHDGDRFTSFDSFLVALDAATGQDEVQAYDPAKGTLLWRAPGLEG